MVVRKSLSELDIGVEKERMRMCQSSEELVGKHSRQRKQARNPGDGKGLECSKEGKQKCLCSVNKVEGHSGCCMENGLCEI